MKIQRISAAMSVAKANQISQTQQAQVSKNATNPIESNSSKASQIIRNYFMGSQMVNPAFTGFPCTTSNFKVKELEDNKEDGILQQLYRSILEYQEKMEEMIIQ